MPEMDQPAPTRRRYRFGLRTLLAVVTLAAVGAWGYWIGWPSWKIHREQARFEESLDQLHVGVTSGQVWGMHSWHKPDLRMYASRADGIHMTLSRYLWSNRLYFIYYLGVSDRKYGSESVPSTSLEVFRVKPPPPNYTPQTERGRKALDPSSDGWGFMGDFLEFISGDRKTNPGFQYELIYSDPPVNPVAK
jgi:hypothetical protein